MTRSPHAPFEKKKQKVNAKQAEKLKGATIMNTPWNHTENATNRIKKGQAYG